VALVTGIALLVAIWIGYGVIQRRGFPTSPRGN
jgi:hypothetical protein